MSISRSAKDELINMFTRMHGYANYLLTEIPKHEKLFQERKCYSDLMETIGEIHLKSLAGIGFLNLLSIRTDESEEESFLEETESSEEDNSEDVIFLGSNYENDEKQN